MLFAEPETIFYPILHFFLIFVKHDNWVLVTAKNLSLHTNKLKQRLF
jgi:sugar diacid utilization regulator